MPRPRRRRQEPRHDPGPQAAPQPGERREPQPEPQPGEQAAPAQARPQGKPRPRPQPRPQPRPPRDPQAGPQPDEPAAAQPRPPSKPRPRPQPRPQRDPQGGGQPRPPRDPQAKPQTRARPGGQPARPQRDPQAKPHAKPQPGGQPARPQRDPQAKPQPGEQPRPQAEPRAQPERRPARPERRPERRVDRRPERRYSPPRLPADGIKARTQRGEFGESWWAKRWVAVLEGFGYGGRLARGRTYARGGAVLSMEFGSGQVTARVQGSRPSPYVVKINVPPLSDEQWARAIEAMAEQAIFAAKLLAGEMPLEIEEAFAAAQVPLFPRSARDLTTHCSCPDPANPCKHIAAVYYLLGERFDSDPFLLFELRGRTKEQIGDALRALRAEGVDEEELPAAELERAPALADLLASFDDPGTLDSITPQIAPPELEAPLLRRYGPPPAATGDDLSTVYRTLSRLALDRLLGGE